MKLVSLLSAIASLAFAQLTSAAVYNVDGMHSSVAFSVTHMMISKVNGRFDKHEASFKFDDKTGDLSDVNAKIDLDSVNTAEPKRDGHLKSPDFFSARDKDGKLVPAKQWMTFKSKAAAKINVATKAPATLPGDLTLNGVTKPVTLNVTYLGSSKDMMDPTVTRVGFEATAKINRKDFGLTWNKTLDAGGVAVGDEVTISLGGEGVPAKAAGKK